MPGSREAVAASRRTSDEERASSHSFGEGWLTLVDRTATARRDDALAELVRVLDRAGIAVVLYDRRGRVWQATAAVESLLREDAEAATALAEARRLAVARVRHRGTADRETVSTRHWTYCLVAGDLPGTSICAPAVAVVVARRDPGALTDAQLRDRYGLTPRELEVARLVADGRSTPQVATAIEISGHTARHHLERVFAKLGVRTRAALQALLRGGHAPGRAEDEVAAGVTVSR